ncbi:hypothetical protein MBH78_15570 [Oceanimonas sp. NS1]|nr:hypothetical protein [Oceanimonas sp. NS1]
MLDGVELYNQEGEASGTFTIDFERQDWLLAGESDLGAVLLVDEKGAGLSPLSPHGPGHAVATAGPVCFE